MADLNLMRKLYSNMPDEQLLFRAIHEKKDMTPEAIQVMDEEIIKRGLDVDAARATEQAVRYQDKKWEQVAEALSDESIESIWSTVLEEKRLGATDSELILTLQQRGVSLETATLFVQEAPAECKRKLDKYDAYIFYGSSAVVAGILLYILGLKAGIIFAAWGLVLVGGLRFFLGLAHRGKYSALLKLMKNNP